MTRKTRASESDRLPRLVESTNSLSSDSFFDKFWLNREKLTNNEYDMKVSPLDANLFVKAGFLEHCFKLIEESSRDDYEKSEMSWSPSKKKKEMVLPDMKYLILSLRRGDDLACEEVAGFASFMVTYEDGLGVIYLYEIHLAPMYRGAGLGKALMNVVEEIGSNVGLGKTMLTVFKSNQTALRWYRGLGYTVDEFSPEPRRLRNGTIKEPTYLILSKSLKT